MAQTLTGSLQNESLPEAEITCQHRNKNELPNIPPPLSFIFNLKNQTPIVGCYGVSLCKLGKTSVRPIC